MLINNKVKLIIIARKFKAPLAISFFGSSCYERCVRSYYMFEKTLKIRVNTGNFTDLFRV